VCDWYLELAKPALSGAGSAGADSAGSDEAARVTREVLGYVLDRLLKLLHPVMPFVTEELGTALTGGGIEGARLAPHETSIRSLLRLTVPGDRVTATAAGPGPTEKGRGDG